jgi:hypothetical protein
MNVIALILICWTLLPVASTARADGAVGGVSAEIIFEHDEFIPGETVKAGVRIINRSGETLQLGQDKSWLKFSMESSDNRFVREIAAPDVSGVFSLPSSAMGTKKVPLTRYWDLQRPGRYTVSASLQIPSWPDPIPTQPKIFDITPGLPVKSVEFGVPPVNGRTNAEPETCRYVLEKLDRHGRVTLYFALTDASGAKIYEAFPLCDMPSTSRPEIQVDQHSNAHILVQTEVKFSVYFEINFAGAILARQTYRFGAAVPDLGVDRFGNIGVSRAVREARANDLPPAEALDSASANAPPSNQ